MRRQWSGSAHLTPRAPPFLPTIAGAALTSQVSVLHHFSTGQSQGWPSRPGSGPTLPLWSGLYVQGQGRGLHPHSSDFHRGLHLSVLSLEFILDQAIRRAEAQVPYTGSCPGSVPLAARRDSTEAGSGPSHVHPQRTSFRGSQSEFLRHKVEIRMGRKEVGSIQIKGGGMAHCAWSLLSKTFLKPCRCGQKLSEGEL